MYKYIYIYNLDNNKTKNKLLDSGSSYAIAMDLFIYLPFSPYTEPQSFTNLIISQPHKLLLLANVYFFFNLVYYIIYSYIFYYLGSLE